MKSKKLYTLEEVERISTQSYMRGLAVQAGQIKQNDGYTFNKWLNDLIKNIKPKQRR
jgi:hypothetical protein